MARTITVITARGRPGRPLTGLLCAQGVEHPEVLPRRAPFGQRPLLPRHRAEAEEVRRSACAGRGAVGSEAPRGGRVSRCPGSGLDRWVPAGGRDCAEHAGPCLWLLSRHPGAGGWRGGNVLDVFRGWSRWDVLVDGLSGDRRKGLGGGSGVCGFWLVGWFEQLQ